MRWSSAAHQVLCTTIPSAAKPGPEIPHFPLHLRSQAEASPPSPWLSESPVPCSCGPPLPGGTSHLPRAFTSSAPRSAAAGARSSHCHQYHPLSHSCWGRCAKRPPTAPSSTPPCLCLLVRTAQPCLQAPPGSNRHLSCGDLQRHVQRPAVSSAQEAERQALGVHRQLRLVRGHHEGWRLAVAQAGQARGQLDKVAARSPEASWSSCLGARSPRRWGRDGLAGVGQVDRRAGWG